MTNCKYGLQYSAVIKRPVGEAKKPGFTVDSRATLAELVAVDGSDGSGLWATASERDYFFKRLTETTNRVFPEREERSAIGGLISVVNSMSGYEFNDAGKITHIDRYLQMAPPCTDMLKSSAGVQLSEFAKST